MSVVKQLIICEESRRAGKNVCEKGWGNTNQDALDNGKLGKMIWRHLEYYYKSTVEVIITVGDRFLSRLWFMNVLKVIESTIGTNYNTKGDFMDALLRMEVMLTTPENEHLKQKMHLHEDPPSKLRFKRPTTSRK